MVKNGPDNPDLWNGSICPELSRLVKNDTEKSRLNQIRPVCTRLDQIGTDWTRIQSDWILRKLIHEPKYIKKWYFCLTTIIVFVFKTSGKTESRHRHLKILV